MSTVGLWDPRVRFSSLFITQGDGCFGGRFIPLFPGTPREKRERLSEERKWKGGAKGSCNWYLSFFRAFLTYRGPNESGLLNHTLTISHSFLMWLSLWRGCFSSLSSLVFWNSLLVKCMTKGVQPTSVENKTLSCMDKLFSPNVMAARYACGLSFFILFTYLHLFFPYCCLVQVREKRHEGFKTLATVIKCTTEEKRKGRDGESNTGGWLRLR